MNWKQINEGYGYTLPVVYSSWKEDNIIAIVLDEQCQRSRMEKQISFDSNP